MASIATDPIEGSDHAHRRRSVSDGWKDFLPQGVPFDSKIHILRQDLADELGLLSFYAKGQSASKNIFHRSFFQTEYALFAAHTSQFGRSVN